MYDSFVCFICCICVTCVIYLCFAVDYRPGISAVRSLPVR